MQRFGFIRPVRSLLCVAAFAACGAATAAETIKIAFIEVLSGAFAFTGQGSLNQLREVVAQLNTRPRRPIRSSRSCRSTARARRRKAPPR